MTNKQVIVNGVNFEVWEKSFRIYSDMMIGPIHFLDDNLEDSMHKVADVMKDARRRHERDTKAMARLSDPNLE